MPYKTLPRGARALAARHGRAPRLRRQRRARRGGFGASVGQWPAFPDSADALRAPAGALQAGRDHELRRRPLRAVRAASRRRVRLRDHGPAGRQLQARPRATSSSPSSASASRASASCTSPRASSTITCPPRQLGMTSVWIDRRQGRGGGASLDVEAHPDATLPEHGGVRRRRRAGLAVTSRAHAAAGCALSWVGCRIQRPCVNHRRMVRMLGAVAWSWACRARRRVIVANTSSPRANACSASRRR